MDCTVCKTSEYVIVASGDPQGFHRGISGEKGPRSICDRCFEILETGKEPAQGMLIKRKEPAQ